jgi:acyl carrier protein
MPELQFTDAVLREQLLAVGADRNLSSDDLDRTFENLGLDSLARVEFAARVQDRFGLDVEEYVVPECTPNEIRSLVQDRLVGAGV